MTRISRESERTATAAELAAERAKVERARAGNITRTLHALCRQAASAVPCGQCGTPPGRPCDGGDGWHLQRFARARRAGLMTADELARVIRAAVVLTTDTIVREDDDSQPYCRTCGALVGLFRGLEGWRHFRGEGTAASPVELFDAGHAPAVGWRVPEGGSR